MCELSRVDTDVDMSLPLEVDLEPISLSIYTDQQKLELVKFFFDKIDDHVSITKQQCNHIKQIYHKLQGWSVYVESLSCEDGSDEIASQDIENAISYPAWLFV